MKSEAKVSDRFGALPDEMLRGMKRGIEKESLRARPDGTLALTPHSPGLGSALTHPHITTDFSESQLELITGAHPSVEEMLEELTEIHQFVVKEIGEEVLWAASMPCKLPPDGEIPLGRYGTSNVGRAKTIYRSGLSYRYGRRMQAISGIHYNWSVPGRSNDEYFALLRNFRRHAWLLFYLFGASPAVCSSFVSQRDHQLKELKPGTMYLPHATSLRMGRLGYQSDAQSSIAVSFNSLEDYGASLQEALTKPYPPYEKIGLKENEEYRQLSTTLLQIENEFYGKIRPKRRIKTGERPLHALRDRGVEYVEVRLMDLDPFAAIGITAQTCRMLDVFLLDCLTRESPRDTPAEIAAINRNQERVAQRGREPNLMLERNDGKGGTEIGAREWGEEILAQCEPIAERLDRIFAGAAHAAALDAARKALKDPESVPSARVLHAMERNHDGSFLNFVIAQSLAHKAQLKHLDMDPKVEARFTQTALGSLEMQRKIEAADKVDFETFRKRYLDPASLRV